MNLNIKQKIKNKIKMNRFNSWTRESVHELIRTNSARNRTGPPNQTGRLQIMFL